MRDLVGWGWIGYTATRNIYEMSKVTMHPLDQFNGQEQQGIVRERSTEPVFGSIGEVSEKRYDGRKSDTSSCTSEGTSATPELRYNKQTVDKQHRTEKNNIIKNTYSEPL
ncbi:MAG: hypothetical protein LBE34_02165 [Flavobacteriaceae bacterium]|nr:hypothetical protein [Flavobacteriaceae bacterium]